MATIEQYIIDTDGVSGDYDGVDDFFSNYSGSKNLVSADKVIRLVCQASTGVADTTIGISLVDPTWNTDDTRRIEIVAAEGHRAGHKWDTSKYILSGTMSGGEIIDCEGGIKILVKGLQIYGGPSSGTGKKIFDPDGSSNAIWVEDCFIRMHLTGSGWGYGILYTSSDYGHVKNCIWYGNGGSIGAAPCIATGSGAVTIVNNLLIGWRFGIDSGGANTKAINNIARDQDTGDYGYRGTFHADSDYNSDEVSGYAVVKSPRSNTSSPWYSGATSNADIWTDFAGYDFSLKSDSTIFSGVGIGPSSNSDVPDDDIDGDVRTGTTTDLGPDTWGAVATLDQEGFRWRNDDGSESAATWRQIQDTNDSIGVEANIRLRMLLNGTEDPASKQFKIQCKKKTDPASEWRDLS